MFDLERCANCGCADIDHAPVPLDPGVHFRWCPPDCEEEHESETDVECSCGCTDFTMLDDPYEQLCDCGCRMEDHELAPDETDEWDEDLEPDEEPEGSGPLLPPTEQLSRVTSCPCGSCTILRSAGTVAQLLIERSISGEPVDEPHSLFTVREITSVTPDFLGESMPVLASFVLVDGQVRRLDGPVPEGVRLLVVLAESRSGLPVAVNWFEL